MSKYRDERGIVFIAALALVAVLALAGIVSLVTTTTDITISSNYKSSLQASFAAQAGAEEARARLRGPTSAARYAGDPDVNPDEDWSAYILSYGTWTTSSDPGYDASYDNYIPLYTPTPNHTNTTVTANSLQTNLLYWVFVRHKKESDLFAGEPYTNNGSGADDIIYYGYATSTSTTLEQFTTNSPNLSMCAPVEIIRSYGMSGRSVKGIDVQVRRVPGPPIVAALYGKSVSLGGSSITVDGTDSCGQSNLTSVVYNTTYTTNGNPNVVSPVGASPTAQMNAINCTIYVNALEPMKTITLTSEPPSGYTVGSSSNYEIVYCDASVLTSPSDGKLDLSNVTGYGTLVVKGKLSFSGNLTWHGLIIATDDIDFSGGGSGAKNVYGAVLGNDVADLSGSVNVQYDSCEIENAKGRYAYPPFRWKDSGLK